MKRRTLYIGIVIVGLLTAAVLALQASKGRFSYENNCEAHMNVCLFHSVAKSYTDLPESVQEQELLELAERNKERCNQISSWNKKKECFQLIWFTSPGEQLNDVCILLYPKQQLEIDHCIAELRIE